LAFLNPEMARSKGLGEDHLLFGAYPRERAAEVEEGLRGALESYRGRVVAAAEAYRVWGERFFPSVPSQPIPKIIRGFSSPWRSFWRCPAAHRNIL
jgi:hypothetical protein